METNSKPMEPSLEITGLITPILTTLKRIGDEWKNFLEIGIQDYLTTQIEKYYYVNTFLHRSEKVRFFDIYFPLNLEYKQKTISFSRPQEIMSKYRYLTIIGIAGSGKSTLVKNIFLKSLSDNYKIPVLIELRHLNEDTKPLQECITSKISNNRIMPSDPIIRRSLQSGKFLFILDGYDEIYSTKKQLINKDIDCFIDAYPLNDFIITSRPGAGIENFNRFHDFSVKEFEKPEIISFIHKMVADKERRERIIKIVGSQENNSYLSYLKNPLLLSMFILAFESHPEIPKKRSAFYRNVFDTLYSRHDGITKNSFPREKLTGLQREDFDLILQIFSYLTYMKEKYAFTEEVLTDNLQKVKDLQKAYTFNIENLIYDLVTSISILIKDGFEYKFPHRTLQEYFFVLFIVSLNDDKKKIIYTNLMKLLRKNHEANQSIWNLCEELDELSFKKHYVIPTLNDVINDIDGADENELIHSFLTWCSPILKDYKNIIRLLKHDSQLIFEMKICDYDKIYFFPENNNIVGKLEAICKKHSKPKEPNWIPLTKNEHSGLQEEIVDLLIENKFDELILEFKSRISKAISSIKEDILNKEASLDILLNS